MAHMKGRNIFGCFKYACFTRLLLLSLVYKCTMG